MTFATIRPATVEDVPVIFQFIGELADYEKLRHQVTATEAGLRQALFGEYPGAEAILALVGEQPVGFALFFPNFSTFAGGVGLHLEDLYVQPAFRQQGIGEKLLRHVAGIALQRRCCRFEWSALDWNEPAVRFYRKLGAQSLDDWTIFRVAGNSLRQLGCSDG